MIRVYRLEVRSDITVGMASMVWCGSSIVSIIDIAAYHYYDYSPTAMSGLSFK